MKRQGTGNERQETGGREQGTARLEERLREAMTPVGDEPEMGRDLWPAMEQRLRRKERQTIVPWFDWALAGGVAMFAVAFPAAVPVLLYYL